MATTNDHWHNCVCVEVTRVSKSTRSEARESKIRGNTSSLGALPRPGALVSCAASKCIQSRSVPPLLLSPSASIGMVLAGAAVSFPAYTYRPAKLHPLAAVCTRVRFGMRFLRVISDGEIQLRFFYIFVQVVNLLQILNLK
jgi:hypothetical protein